MVNNRLSVFVAHRTGKSSAELCRKVDLNYRTFTRIIKRKSGSEVNLIKIAKMLDMDLEEVKSRVKNDQWHLDNESEGYYNENIRTASK